MNKAEVYEKYKRLVYSIVVAAKEDAEDLMQDTFLSFFENYSCDMEDDKIKNTLCLIAKNKLKNFYKKEKPYEYID